MTMTAAPADSFVSLTAARLSRWFAAEMPRAEAAGQAFELLLEFQAASCSDWADAVFLQATDQLAEIQEGKGEALAAFQRTFREALETIATNARTVAAQQGAATPARYGADPERVEMVVAVGQKAFRERMETLFTHSPQRGRP